MTAALNPNTLITVYAICLRASCWHGEFYCENFKTAGTKELSPQRLRELALEHSDYWRVRD